jgi:hypothetical protein
MKELRVLFSSSILEEELRFKKTFYIGLLINNDWYIYRLPKKMPVGKITKEHYMYDSLMDLAKEQQIKRDSKIK